MKLSDLELHIVELAIIDAMEFVRKEKATKENSEKKELFLEMYNKIIRYQINQ